jgi:hypothetical protein
MRAAGAHRVDTAPVTDERNSRRGARRFVPDLDAPGSVLRQLVERDHGWQRA